MAPTAVRIERTTRASRIGAVGAALVLVGLVSLPAWGDPSTMRILVEFIALLVLAQMWNLLAGYAGLVSIGQQAYVGLGGYALIVLADDLGVNPFLAVPLAGLVAAALALPTAALVFRFHGGYFAVGTWAIAEVYRLLIANTRRARPRLGPHAEGGVPAGPREPGADDLRPGAGHRRGRARRRLRVPALALRARAHGDPRQRARRPRRWASTSSAPSSCVYVGVAFGTGVDRRADLSEPAPHLAGRRLQHQLDGLHDLHRRDRRARHARGPADRHRALLPAARAASPTTGPGT